MSKLKLCLNFKCQLTAGEPGEEFNTMTCHSGLRLKMLGRFFLLGMGVVWLSNNFYLSKASPGPQPAHPAPPIIAPEDKPFSGVIHLGVDASDVDRRIVNIHETIPTPPGEMVLLYPKWLPGTHSPEGPIDRVAGIVFKAKGKSLDWTRDPIDMNAFHVTVPENSTELEIEFQYLSPTTGAVGGVEITQELLVLEWNELALYPAGYFTRGIEVAPMVTLPRGWKYGTALEPVTTNGNNITFKQTSLETVVDSPIYAGRNFARHDLDPGGPAPVHLDIIADRATLLAITPEQLKAHRKLVQQAYKLFDAHHYDHYDFLLALSDQLHSSGLEHHRSSENTTEPKYFTDWEKGASGRDLMPHEFTHSWNGKFRRPADLWTPNYDVPMRDDLLWVYEGQTEYWGQVLAARSGIWTRQQALDELAQMAAYYALAPGRTWRPIQDTTSDEIINPRRPQSWGTWQSFENYYREGQLIWLDADTLIRELSGNKKSLDDFAKAFFGINDGSYTPVTYTFEDVVGALNAVQPHDWAKFLRTRLDAKGSAAPLDGIQRGGYKLIYNDEPSELFKSYESRRKVTDLIFSIGFRIDKEGILKNLMWDGPAFKAGLTEGVQIVAVNGVAYEADILKEAIKLAKDGKAPIELIVKQANLYRVVAVDYHGGPRYPHLERDPSQPARLDDILAPKK